MRTGIQNGDSAAVLTTTLLQVTEPHLLLHTSAPEDVRVGNCFQQQTVLTVKRGRTDHCGHVTTHTQHRAEEWECCVSNLGCVYKTLQSCSVPWSQNSRGTYMSEVHDWDFCLGTRESTETSVFKCKVSQFTPKPVCNARISHLASKLWKMSLQQSRSRHKTKHSHSTETP